MRRNIVGHGPDRILDPVEVEGPAEMPDQQNPDHEAKIPDPVGEEGLLGGVGGGGFFEPVADQDVGTHPDQFPENKHHHEVVRQDDTRHREHEESEPREVA